MIKIGDHAFKTKKAAAEYVRVFLNEHMGKTIPIYRLKEFHFLHCLVSLHPNAKEKILDGIANFIIKQNTFYNTGKPEVWIENVSGRLIDFSWRKCISGNDTPKQAKLIVALRHAIKNQIHNFYKLNPLKVCAICKCGLVNVQIHIDHIYPFKFIVEDFLRNWDGELPTTYSDINSFSESDSLLENSWQRYHQKHATLQVVCATCNLTKKQEMK